jgi:hypothetical protein
MIVWRGFGVAVVGLTFVALLLTELGVEGFFANDAYYQEHGWPKLLALVAAAGLVWLLSKQLEKRPAQVVIDKQTGHEIALKNKHDLFFVPLRYWPTILVVGGFAIMIFG